MFRKVSQKQNHARITENQTKQNNMRLGRVYSKETNTNMMEGRTRNTNCNEQAWDRRKAFHMMAECSSRIVTCKDQRPTSLLQRRKNSIKQIKMTDFLQEIANDHVKIETI